MSCNVDASVDRDSSGLVGGSGLLRLAIAEVEIDWSLVAVRMSKMTQHPEVEFGDEVRIVSTPETDARGYAGRTGVCHGFTTPSVTGVEVIGEMRNDRALHVHFDHAAIEDAWFSPDLLEFVSHVEGTVIGIGDKTFRRNADGSWSRD